MRVCSLFPALHLHPSDTTREHPTRAGITGLRHKFLGRNVRPIVWGYPHPPRFVNVLGRVQKNSKKWAIQPTAVCELHSTITDVQLTRDCATAAEPDNCSVRFGQVPGGSEADFQGESRKPALQLPCS
jgi:hypothetical protein